MVDHQDFDWRFARLQLETQFSHAFASGSPDAGFGKLQRGTGADELQAGLMREFAGHPGEIALRTIHYLERDHLGDFIRVQALDFGAQFFD